MPLVMRGRKRRAEVDDWSDEDDVGQLAPVRQNTRTSQGALSTSAKSTKHQSPSPATTLSPTIKLTILGCRHYLPNDSVGFHKLGQVLPFNPLPQSLEDVRSWLLKHLKLDPAQYYVHLHGPECKDALGDMLPKPHYNGSLTILAHVVSKGLEENEDVQIESNFDQSDNSGNDNEGNGGDITTLVKTTTDENGATLHYLRVGSKTFEAVSDGEIEYIGVVLSRINTAAQVVNFVLADSWVVSGVQYGHCDLGVVIDMSKVAWEPDPQFIDVVKDMSEFESLLLSIGLGDIKIYEVEEGPPDPEVVKECPFVRLPIEPDYEIMGVPTITGDLASQDRILCVVYFANNTNIDVNLNHLINLQYPLDPNATHDEFRDFILRSDDDPDDDFKGLIKFLRGRLGRYGRDWGLEIFVLPQIPESRMLWSWTHNVPAWRANRWLSGDSNEKFDRNLYIEVHMTPLDREEIESRNRPTTRASVEKTSHG